MIVDFVIPGPPVPWMRAAPTGVRGRSLNPKRYRDYKRHVASCGNAAVMLQTRGKWPTDRVYDIRLRMCFPDLRTRDDDNVEKAIKDGLKGVLWHDDSWTYFRRIVKTLEMDAKRPRVEITVQVFDPEAQR